MSKLKYKSQAFAPFKVRLNSDIFLFITRHLISLSDSLLSRGTLNLTDNIIIERFWRGIKYEKIHLNEYNTVKELRTDISDYMEFYNNERPHQSLKNEFPETIYKNNENNLLKLKIKSSIGLAA